MDTFEITYDDQPHEIVEKISETLKGLGLAIEMGEGDDGVQEYNIVEHGVHDLHPDIERMNKLQSLTTGYGKGWILRDSSTGRGTRLHETELDGATPDVREAIDNYDLS